MLYEKVNSKLRGTPEHFITIALLIVSIIALLVAAYGSPMMKASVAAWFIAP